MNSEIERLAALRTQFKRRARWGLLLICTLLPFVIHGARASVDGMRITPETWVSREHPQRQVFERFRTEFEGNDVLYLSWEGGTLDDPRLLQLESVLQSRNVLEVKNSAGNSVSSGVPGEIVPFERVLSGPGAIADLMAPPLRLPEEQAIERMTGFLIGPDGETSCVVVVLTHAGNEHRRESIVHLLSIAAEVTGLSESELIIAGPPHDGVAIDDESLRGINQYGLLSTLIAAVFCVVCLRSWRITGTVLGVACLGQGIVLAAVFYGGYTLDAILIVSPPLIFVLTVSAGIHFVNYFREESPELPAVERVARAWQVGSRPCWLATLTTAVGLCSLGISRIAPVAAFGVLSAFGLLLTIGLLLLLLPDALVKWPPRDNAKVAVPLYRFGLENGLQRTGVWVVSRPRFIAVGFLLLALLSIFGTRQLRTSVDATGLFAEETRIIRDYQWIESRIGGTVPVEVLIHFDRNAAHSLLDQVLVVQGVHARLEQVKGIEGVLSGVSFLPDLHLIDKKDVAPVKQAIVNKRLHTARTTLREFNYFQENEQRTSWRITGRVPATAGLSYGRIGSDVEREVARTFDSMPGAVQGVHVEFSGMMPLIENVQVTILNDLIRSLLTAFGLIGLVVLIVLQNFRLALVVTFLNMLPVLLVFGGMGGSSIPIDIGTMMTAGVALGIAVDDTVHFLCYYRKRLGVSESPTEAVQQTIVTCGAAMLQTTLVCSAGMLVFACSTFVPTRQFGVMMTAILIAAVVCDLLCLPALLLIGKRTSTRASHSSREAPAYPANVGPLVTRT